MNERIKELVKQSGGDFWQRIESDGVLNKEAYITFDPPQSLEKFAELIVKDCACVPTDMWGEGELDVHTAVQVHRQILKHFGIEE